MLNVELMKADLQRGKLLPVELAMWLIEAWKSNPEKEKYAQGVNVLEIITHDRNIRCNLSLAVQWANVFIQSWIKDQTMIETLTSYEYPNGIPNLTIDVTNDWVINEPDQFGNYSITCKLYGHTVPFRWEMVENGQFARFTTRYVMLPDQTILQFD
ncbi:hypothetical protein AB6D15_18440 [Vibrio splendidus]